MLASWGRYGWRRTGVCIRRASSKLSIAPQPYLVKHPTLISTQREGYVRLANVEWEQKMLVPVVLTLLLGLMFSVHELLSSTQPVRHVVRRYGSSYRGYWPSSKGIGSGPIPYESGLARDFLRLCEFLPDVMQIVAEPRRLTYELDGITY
jgi:hypothetical protein